MIRGFRHAAAAALLAPAAVAACGPATRAAPAAAAPAAEAAPAAAPAPGPRAYTAADVRFMQHMIVHHAQALEMTALVAERTQNEAIRRLAQRIEVSQHDEIAQMQRWLRERGEEVPSLASAGEHATHAQHDAHGAHGGTPAHAAMPGMLTREEMARLAAARGAEFDRLFLELMIRHHEGALVMVEELFASEGAGQEVDVFRIAAEVDADQRMEIERMQALLAAMPQGSHHR